MSQHTIRVDEEVWKALDKKAHDLDMNFVSRNTILRKILDLPDAPLKSGASSKRMANFRPGKRPPTR